jgi:hypothetical protein
MAEQSIPLSVYLLRSDRVGSFEAALSVGTAALPLVPPLDGYAIGLPSAPRTPEWVPVVQSVLQSPVGFSMVGQSGRRISRRAPRWKDICPDLWVCMGKTR